jgi:hypothetical protein
MQVDFAHKTKPRGELLGYKGRILGLLVFGVVAVSRFGGFWHRCELNAPLSCARGVLPVCRFVFDASSQKKKQKRLICEISLFLRSLQL